MNPIIFFLLPTKTYISIIWFPKLYISHMEAYKHNFSIIICMKMCLSYMKGLEKLKPCASVPPRRKAATYLHGSMGT